MKDEFDKNLGYYYDDIDYPIIVDLVAWFQEGVDKGATHLIITYDGGYYPPTYVFPDGDSLGRVEQLCRIAGHIMGVYELSVPLTQEQINRNFGS